MSAIQLRNISKTFSSDSPALDDVSFEVGDHEVVTIVGPSGCGKSTLLRIVAGLEQPTAGSVEIAGKVMNAVPARLRNIAMVFQSYALYPHMTCFENLALNLRLKHVPPLEIDRRVRETAALLQIKDLLHKKPRELSGGQRQRVAVGRALIRNPQVYLFDEPLSNLDALLRERVRHELKELFTKLGAAVVYVTHDQVEAMTMADRVIVLDHGRIQQIGPPEELYSRPATRFVGGFIGSPSMNLIETQIAQGKFRLGTEWFDTGLDWSGPATIGIRPEEIALSASGIQAEVKWVEHLGAQYHVGVQAEDHALSLISARRPPLNHVCLKIETAKVHVFEASSGAHFRVERLRTPVRV